MGELGNLHAHPRHRTACRGGTPRRIPPTDSPRPHFVSPAYPKEPPLLPGGMSRAGEGEGAGLGVPAPSPLWWHLRSPPPRRAACDADLQDVWRGERRWVWRREGQNNKPPHRSTPLLPSSGQEPSARPRVTRRWRCAALPRSRTGAGARLEPRDGGSDRPGNSGARRGAPRSRAGPGLSSARGDPPARGRERAPAPLTCRGGRPS